MHAGHVRGTGHSHATIVLPGILCLLLLTGVLLVQPLLHCFFLSLNFLLLDDPTLTLHWQLVIAALCSVMSHVHLLVLLDARCSA